MAGKKTFPFLPPLAALGLLAAICILVRPAPAQDNAVKIIPIVTENNAIKNGKRAWVEISPAGGRMRATFHAGGPAQETAISEKSAGEALDSMTAGAFRSNGNERPAKREDSKVPLWKSVTECTRDKDGIAFPGILRLLGTIHETIQNNKGKGGKDKVAGFAKEVTGPVDTPDAPVGDDGENGGPAVAVLSSPAAENRGQ